MAQTKQTQQDPTMSPTCRLFGKVFPKWKKQCLHTTGGPRHNLDFTGDLIPMLLHDFDVEVALDPREPLPGRLSRAINGQYSRNICSIAD